MLDWPGDGCFGKEHHRQATPGISGGFHLDPCLDKSKGFPTLE